jgi:hypothetical protein
MVRLASLRQSRARQGCPPGVKDTHPSKLRSVEQDYWARAIDRILAPEWASPRCEKVRRAADILSVPVVEWWAIFDPAVAVAETACAWPWSAPSRLAPSIGSWPTDPYGTARIGTTKGTVRSLNIAASIAIRGRFGNDWRRTGLGPGFRRRLISDPDYRCGRDCTRFGAARGWRPWIEHVYRRDISLAQMVGLPDHDGPPDFLLLLPLFISVRSKRETA